MTAERIGTGPWRRPGLLCLAFLAALAAAPVPARSQDPPPAWLPDGCSYWENSTGVLFFYPSGSAEPMDARRAARFLELILTGLREDPGTILIEAHMDGAEAAAGEDGLDRRRAEAIRDALVARGVPAHVIYILALGHARPLVPHPEPGTPEVQNRRVAVRNTSRGRSCMADRQRVLAEWFRRNCFPNRRAEVASCDAILGTMTWQY